MSRPLPEPPRTPFELDCSVCGRARIVLPTPGRPERGVYLCMHCDHGGPARATAPVLQAYIDRGYKV